MQKNAKTEVRNTLTENSASKRTKCPHIIFSHLCHPGTLISRDSKELMSSTSSSFSDAVSILLGKVFVLMTTLYSRYFNVAHSNFEVNFMRRVIDTIDGSILRTIAMLCYVPS